MDINTLDINTFSNLITGGCFPIACCIFLFNQNNNMQKILTSLTIAMNSIVDRLERIEDVIELNQKNKESK